MTRRTTRVIAALAVVAAVSLVPAGIALAEDADPAGITETTVGFEPGTEPAVVVSDAVEADDDAAWTFRFLVPTLLVLSALALAGVIIWYGFGIKGRYRVVR